MRKKSLKFWCCSSARQKLTTFPLILWFFIFRKFSHKTQFAVCSFYSSTKERKVFKGNYQCKLSWMDCQLVQPPNHLKVAKLGNQGGRNEPILSITNGDGRFNSIHTILEYCALLKWQFLHFWIRNLFQAWRLNYLKFYICLPNYWELWAE